MELKVIAKQMFFDSPKVMSAVDKATRKVLSKFGAFVRTRSRTSIRRRKGISQPGQPPSSHAGHLRRLIFFGYDSSRRSVVIGPTPFGEGEAPELLEQEHVPGTVRRVTRPDRTSRASGSSDKRGRRRTMTYRARPFMGPAFEKEKEGLPALWANSIR